MISPSKLVNLCYTKMKSSKSLIFDSKYMIQIPNLQTPIHIFSTREVLKTNKKILEISRGGGRGGSSTVQKKTLGLKHWLLPNNQFLAPFLLGSWSSRWLKPLKLFKEAI